MFRFNLVPEYNKQKSPDRLILDFKRRRGEFSIEWDINFERYLEKIEAMKKAGTYQVRNFIKEYKEGASETRKRIKRKVMGK